MTDDAAAPMSSSAYASATDALGVPCDRSLLPLQRRATLPSWYVGALVSTAPARQHLQDFGAAVPSTLWEQRATLDELMVGLDVVGDPSLLTDAADAIRELPPPLVWHAMQHCTLLVIGRQYFGWAGGRPRTDPRRPYFLTAVATRTRSAFRHVCRHEVGHAWLLGAPEELASALYQSAWTEAEAVPAHLADDARAVRRRSTTNEADVDALLVALGFPCSDPGLVPPW